MRKLSRVQKAILSNALKSLKKVKVRKVRVELATSKVYWEGVSQGYICAYRHTEFATGYFIYERLWRLADSVIDKPKKRLPL
jgi:hypothetical protein